MNWKDQGGAAFPVDARAETGMSLRDWFAGQALCGLAAKSDLGGKWVEYADAAYKLADAMLKRRDTNS